MSIYDEIDLQECPACGGPGLLEEEQGWCMYVMCLDCGAQTGEFPFKTQEEKKEAAKAAAEIWNMGKVVSPQPGQ